MGFCSCTAKFLLYIFNLICALVGLAVLSLAVYSYLQNNTVKDFLHGQVSGLLIAMMVLGGITFLVAFLGCCGAVNDDPCCISTYGTFLSIIFICQIVLGGFLVYANQNGEIEKQIRSYLKKDFDNYSQNPRPIDIVQRGIQCCGYDGPSLWYITNLPSSCCPIKNQDSNQRFLGDTCLPPPLGNAYKDGCANKVVSIVSGSFKSGSTTLFIVGAVELLCIVCAFCVARSIRRDQMAGYSY